YVCVFVFFFFQAEDGIRDDLVTGVQTCALPIYVLQEHAQRAGAAMQRNDFATAETEYRAVLVMAPQLAEMRSNLGIALYMLGKFDQAEKEFRVALRSNPRLFVPNYFLGERLFQTNRYAEARTFFQTASELKP